MLYFHKYHGLGNDFILIDAFAREKEILKSLNRSTIVELCKRKYGIGADGIILLTKSTRADFGMKLFNADGSPAEISGNGLRCLALFIAELKLNSAPDFSIETGGGVNRVEITGDNMVKVQMPRPNFDCEAVPMLSVGYCIEREWDFAGEQFAITALSVGNPHCVIFGNSELEFAEKWGPIIESDPVFPKKVNVEFAEMLSKDSIKLVAFERGVGITDACGSGATATVCSAIKTGRAEFDTSTTVSQIGGDLTITATKDFQEIILEGLAVKVFSGNAEL
jgi:diaminopimelate epimerase